MGEFVDEIGGTGILSMCRREPEHPFMDIR